MVRADSGKCGVERSERARLVRQNHAFAELPVIQDSASEPRLECLRNLPAVRRTD